MKTILAAFLLSMSLIAQNINAEADRTTYDSQGRVIAYQYPDGTQELYAYDNLSRMIRFVDRAGGVTTYQYTSDGSVVTVMPDGTTQTNGK